jgi:hypothetical protein
MRKTTQSILFLATLVAALAAAVYAELAHEQRQVPAPLTALDAAAVQRLEVRCLGCQTRRFQRVSGDWRMLEPYALPADTESVARLLAITHASVRARRPMSDYDAVKLGLDPAQITLAFDDLVVAIGGEDPIDHDRYVRISGELLNVPDHFSARLLEAPESELDRHLLPPGATVVGVGLRGDPPRHDLAVAWQNAVALAVRPAPAVAAAGGIPIAVALGDGTHVDFILRRDGAGYLARRSNPALDYVLDETLPQALLGMAK